MLCSYSCIMYPLVLEMSQKVVESVDNIITRWCKTLQPDSLYLTASSLRDDRIQTEHSWTPDMSQKAASGKANW